MISSCVPDANVLADFSKQEDCPDAPREEVLAAKRLIAAVLEKKVTLYYTNKVRIDWTAKGFLSKSDTIFRRLLDMRLIKEIKEGSLPNGVRSKVYGAIENDDLPYAKAAMAIPGGDKVWVTRDPLSTRQASRRALKRHIDVTVLLASETGR